MYFSQYFGFPNFLLVLESPDFKILKSFRHSCVTRAFASSSKSFIYSLFSLLRRTLPVRTRLLQTYIHSFFFLLRFCFLGSMNLVYLSLHMLHQSQERLCFLSRENPCGVRRVMERHGEAPKKVVESSNKCFICSSIPTSKNKVYIFDKTSTHLAGIIRSSLEFDVKKYHDNSLSVCRQCFQQLTKYERAAKKLREIKQELLLPLEIESS